MNIYFKLLVVTSFLYGCGAGPVKTTTAPDGSMLATARCTHTPTECYEKATSQCSNTGGRYQVMDSYSNAGGALADLIPGPVTWYTMSFKCGPSDGQLPTFPFRGKEFNQTSCYKVGNTVNCYGN